MALGNVHERLGIQQLFASLAFGLHLQLELLFYVAVRGFECLNLKSRAVYAPFLDHPRYCRTCVRGRERTCLNATADDFVQFDVDLVPVSNDFVVLCVNGWSVIGNVRSLAQEVTDGEMADNGAHG